MPSKMNFPHEIESNLLSIFPYLRKEDLEQFYQISDLKSYSAKECILISGVTSRKAFYIVKGVVRGYLIDQNGQERDLILRAEGVFTGDPDALLSSHPQTLTFQALTQVNILLFSFEEFEALAYKNKNILTMYLDILKENLIISRNRLNDMILLSKEEYYTKLLQNNPIFLEKAQKKYVANYLGIRPESLTRLIKRIETKKS